MAHTKVKCKKEQIYMHNTVKKQGKKEFDVL